MLINSSARAQPTDLVAGSRRYPTTHRNIGPLPQGLIPLPARNLSGSRITAPIGGRPLSGVPVQGTLVRSAPGLQHRPLSRASSYASSTKFMERPSTILEESSSGSLPSLDTPDTAQKPDIEQPRGDLESQRDVEQVSTRGNGKAPHAPLPPLPADPSHPDLVPEPLAVVKRGATLREGSSGNLGQQVPQRSASDAVSRVNSAHRDNGQVAPRLQRRHSRLLPSLVPKVANEAPGESPVPLHGYDHGSDFDYSLSHPAISEKTSARSLESPSSPQMAQVTTPASPLGLANASRATRHERSVSNSSSDPNHSDASRPFYETEMVWRTYE